MISAIRYALRTLRRAPGFTVTVIATLGIGIGLNAAIFAVVDCVLLRPLGYHDADRIVGLQTHFLDENRSIGKLGGDDYIDVTKQVKGLEVTAYWDLFADGISLNGRALYLPVAIASPRFFEVMGVHPVAGRLFNGSDVNGSDVVVAESFARKYLGSPSAAIGHTIQYGGPHVIVGVLPSGFSFPPDAQVWVEQTAAPANLSRTSYNDLMVGKRRANVTQAQLAAELATFSSHLQRAYVEDAHKTIEAVSLQDQLVGKGFRSMLHLLMGSVGVILLIICANITHLQLVRATRHLRAVTIRTALGASRKALASRALVEAAVLAVGGSMAAVLIAVPALRLLVRLAPAELPRIGEVHLNADVFLFALLLSFVVMAVTAMLPVWRSWHVDPATALRQDAARGSESRGSVRLRDGLIVAEVALTLTLSVSAILLTRMLIANSHQNLGFAAESLVTLDTHDVAASVMPDMPNDKSAAALAKYEAAALPVKLERIAHLDRTLDSLTNTPGVLSVAAILGAPMGFGGSDVKYAVKGRQVFGPGAEHLPSADLRPVTPGIFATMGVPLLRGRTLTVDDRLNAPPVLVIDETLARTVFANEDPIGKQIMCGYDDVQSWWTIVGVVGAIRSDSPGIAPQPTVYVPVAQHAGMTEDIQILVRTAQDPVAMAETLRKSMLQSHPEIAVRAAAMREHIGDTQRAQNFLSLLFGSFAVVSIVLAAVGMYGVTSYSVAQRRFEFGLRFALGANRVQVLGMVLRNALSVAGAGIVLGIGLSFESTHALASLFGKMPAFDPVAYMLAAFGVLVIALCATLLPARRASRIDPMDALRNE